MSMEYNYGKLDLGDAHSIAGGANALLMALQEYAEAGMQARPEAAAFASKGVDLGDALLDMARLLVSRGVFSQERHLSEILIYSAAIADGCVNAAQDCSEGGLGAAVAVMAFSGGLGATLDLAGHLLACAGVDGLRLGPVCFGAGRWGGVGLGLGAGLAAAVPALVALCAVAGGLAWGDANAT
jgi:hypothetical protein